MPPAPDVGEQPMPPVSNGEEQPEDSSEYWYRKQLLLLAVLVASVTYQAGISLPGGVWQEDGGAGVTAWSPILRSIHRGRYLAFFYCNATAFVASIVIIFLLLNKSLTSWVQLAVLRLVMVLDLLGLMGAYLAGSCRERTTTVYTAALVLALSTYIGVHILLALYSQSHAQGPERDDDNEQPCGTGGNAPPAAMTRILLKPKVLLLLANFAMAVTYVAGLNPPGGFWDSPPLSRRGGDGGGGPRHGYRPGDSLVEAHHSGHYRMFFYCNSNVFFASLFIIVRSLKGFLQDTPDLGLDRAYSSDKESEEQLRWILEPEAEAVTRRRLNPSDPGKIQFYLHEKRLIYFMEKSPSLLAIAGTAGVGKTNLLRVLRNKYKSSFDYVFFAGAAGGVDLLQHVIFINLGLGPPPQTSDVPVAKIISSFLKEESFLLLLDDLRETLDVADVGLPVPLVGHRQKVIFTTRSQPFFTSQAINTIRLQCLEEEDAWSLFRDKVGDEIIHAHPQIKHLAKKIVAECGGLPSTLCTVGRAMSSKRDVKEWRNAYDLLKMKRPPPSEIQGPNEIQESFFDCNEIQEIGDDGYILENASRTTHLFDPNVVLRVLKGDFEALREGFVHTFFGRGIVAPSTSKIRVLRFSKPHSPVLPTPTAVRGTAGDGE